MQISESQLRDILDRYTNDRGEIQGDPATIAAEVAATVGDDLTITEFVLDDFTDLTVEERQAIQENEYLRRKLGDVFLDGLNWAEIAGYAVDAWRITYLND